MIHFPHDSPSIGEIKSANVTICNIYKMLHIGLYEMSLKQDNSKIINEMFSFLNLITITNIYKNN